MVAEPLLNPAQQQVIDLLGRPTEQPEFPAGLAGELQDALDEALAPLVPLLAEDQLWVRKHDLVTVHACEAHHVAEQDAFTWTVPRVRGTVAHKAIELAVSWRGEPVPRDLVDDALERLATGEHGAARFLAGLGEADRAQLRGEATDLVTKFQECFPPLRAAWRPVTESPARYEAAGGRVVLSAKVDLTLGRPEPGRATKVIIDLKSGRPAATHRDDLRFYALVETLRLGVPPRLVASYYLDEARAHPEPVSAGLLQAALARTVDGITKLVELAAGREPQVRPGPVCRWCPRATTCAEGQAYLWSRDDEP